MVFREDYVSEKLALEGVSLRLVSYYVIQIT